MLFSYLFIGSIPDGLVPVKPAMQSTFNIGLAFKLPRHLDIFENQLTFPRFFFLTPNFMLIERLSHSNTAA